MQFVDVVRGSKNTGFVYAIELVGTGIFELPTYSTTPTMWYSTSCAPHYLYFCTV